MDYKCNEDPNPVEDLYETVVRLQNLDISGCTEDNFLVKLSEITQHLKLEIHRTHFPVSALRNLSVIITSSQSNVLAKSEVFRILRNASAGCPNASISDDDWKSTVSATASFIEQHHESEKEECKVAARCALQFLVNLINSKPSLGKAVWENVNEHILSWCSSIDTKISEFSIAVFYGILRASPELDIDIFQNLNVGTLMKEIILKANGGSQFGLLVVHLFLEKENFLNTFYDSFDITTRIFLLSLTEEILIENSKGYCPLANGNLQYLIPKFIGSAEVILQTCEKPSIDYLEPTEVATILQILATATSMEQYRSLLQPNGDLVTSTTDLLRSIHSLGKSGTNSFSILSDLKSFGTLEDGGESDIQNHPVFGFKRNLVRLLGNLCWENQENQDLVRKEEAIPVLLECSNLDARNPFIQQFAVLAVKSICQGNMENQAVIASMTKCGVVQPAILEQIGMSVEDTPSGLKLKRKE